MDNEDRNTSESPWDWLAKQQFENLNGQILGVWDLYLKFYTAFLTANVAGLALTVQYVTGGKRAPVAIAFISQNAISAVTAYMIAWFSARSADRLSALAKHFIAGEVYGPSDEALFCDATIPKRLGVWGGWANVLSHFFFALCWIAVITMDHAPSNITNSRGEPTTAVSIRTQENTKGTSVITTLPQKQE